MNQQINTVREALDALTSPNASVNDLRMKWAAKAVLTTLEAAMREPFGHVRMNPGFDSGVFQRGAQCPSGWPGATAVYLAAPPAQQAQPTESVLVDGIAYDTPAPVAAELLRLHLEGKQAQAEAPDMLKVCEALGFDPTNHHNAAKCPYCTPQQAQAEAVPQEKP